MMRLALLWAAVLPSGGGFELRCYGGRGATQPAFKSTGEHAMVFPNSMWTAAWLESYLSLHPNLQVFDEYNFLKVSVGYAGRDIGVDISQPPDSIGDGFDIPGGQPPDQELFKEIVTTDTGISPSSVTVLSYRQSIRWTWRLPYAPSHFATWQGASAAAQMALQQLLPRVPVDHQSAWLQDASAEFSFAASKYIVRNPSGAVIDATEGNLTLDMDSSRGGVYTLVKSNNFASNLLALVANSTGVVLVSQPAEVFLAVPGQTIGLPTAQTLPMEVGVTEVLTLVEYTVESLRVCNISTAAVDRFHRHDQNNDNMLSGTELPKLLYELGRQSQPGFTISSSRAAVIMVPYDANFDQKLGLTELMVADSHRSDLNKDSISALIQRTGACTINPTF